MDCFINSYGFDCENQNKLTPNENLFDSAYDILCDEFLLDTFKGIK